MHDESDAIAAISTPVGIGSISAVRVSGCKSIEFADKIFKSFDGKKLQDIPGYRAKYGRILYEREVLDEVVALVFKAPKSYTGENSVDFFCHGGVVICKQILNALLSVGVRLAMPGEFSKRAFLNGKISLDKAEAIADLISSEFEKSKKISLSAFNGETGNKIENIKKNLLEIFTNINAKIDYPEDDFSEFSNKNIETQITKLNNEIKQLVESFKFGKIIKCGIKTAIVGSPNVGKSTLMNLLSKKERSIVTDIPGTTRDIIEETILLGNIPLILTDTAGMRETDEVIEKLGAKKALELAHTADLIFYVIDASKDLDKYNIDLMKKFKKNKIVAILNKIDLNHNIDVETLKKISFRVVKISAKKNIGINNLENSIYDFIGISSLKNENLIITNQRQFEILKKVKNLLEKMTNFLNMDRWDILAELIKESIEILGEFSGINVNETVIDEIFSKFCLGK
ncbi:MAG: tRNA uridine-5-carboxymethylaminomethyl(34) synthesis GTPase MnmE [Candidatus Improbicoccus pseudotrichonymphae]|uniref:tRNA modification GTPase MnmE n=1 Tax=Candidatus Improbicoccus pseudotrichonymphae TaxID=3033792 RepID=A0AA48HXG5_9FIRM|nr:MAG: tRNA uridine-5-carboxymethylaminomethyl(34) synthesis GTPase MnmE [Candidatus Improbicoccus pseudotrichonymphae]